MSNPFTAIVADPHQRPLDAMNHAQVGLVLGLVPVLEKAGLILTCPRCAAEGHPQLETDNDPTDETWKIDCQCRRRRSPSQANMMKPSGWLLLMVDELLGPLSLAVRCTRRKCLLTPLTLRESGDRSTLMVTCACGNTYKFDKTKRATTH